MRHSRPGQRGVSQKETGRMVIDLPAPRPMGVNSVFAEVVARTTADFFAGHIPKSASPSTLPCAACASPVGRVSYWPKVYAAKTRDCFLVWWHASDNRARNTRPQKPRAGIWER